MHGSVFACECEGATVVYYSFKTCEFPKVFDTVRMHILVYVCVCVCVCKRVILWMIELFKVDDNNHLSHTSTSG